MKNDGSELWNALRTLRGLGRGQPIIGVWSTQMVRESNTCQMAVFG